MTCTPVRKNQTYNERIFKSKKDFVLQWSEAEVPIHTLAVSYN